MLRETYFARLAWLKISNQDVMDAVEKKITPKKLNKGMISRCFDETSDWARRLNTELDIYTAKLIEDRRKEMLERAKTITGIDKDIRIVLPCDPGYPVIADGKMVGSYYPESGEIR